MSQAVVPVSDRRAIAKMPPRLQRSIVSAITAPARNLRWKIILPFVFLSVVLGLAGTYLTTRIVSGSLGERFDNQLAETARVTSDAFVRKERRQLETLRAISLTEGVVQAVATQDRAALQRFVVPIMANAGVERVDILDADGRLIFGARLSDAQNLRYDPVAAGEDYTSWPGVQSALSARNAQDDKFTAVSTTQSGPYFYSSTHPDQSPHLGASRASSSSAPLWLLCLPRPSWKRWVTYRCTTTAVTCSRARLPSTTPVSLRRLLPCSKALRQVARRATA